MFRNKANRLVIGEKNFWACFIIILIGTSPSLGNPLGCDFESDDCLWQYYFRSFSVITADDLRLNPLANRVIFPATDGSGSPKGHFLFASDENQEKKMSRNISSNLITDPVILSSNKDEKCSLIFALSTNMLPIGNVSVLLNETRKMKVVAKNIGNDYPGIWQIHRINLGKPKAPFKVIVEIGSSGLIPSYVAIDNLDFENCFFSPFDGDCPTAHTFWCKKDKFCLARSSVCDIRQDCSDRDDEKQNCDTVPAGTRCTFENGLCGWHNATENQNNLKWRLNQGPTRNQHSGPTTDSTFRNYTGTYAYVDMSTGTLGSLALMESVAINPPPSVHGNPHSSHYNSCYVTFFIHKYGPHSGSMSLYLLEEQLDGSLKNFRLWWSFGNKGDSWLRQLVILPNVTRRYTLQFEARKAMSSRGDVAIDDISFSPRCFGIGISKKELNGYDYWQYPNPNSVGAINDAFKKEPVYSFSTCGNFGSDGPTAEDCQYTYSNTSTRVDVLESLNGSLRGIQRWTVPESNYYTIISKGARGGKGADGLGESRGAQTRLVMELFKGQEIYLLVGQEGQDACRKLSFDAPSCLVDYQFRTVGNLETSTIPKGGRALFGGGGGGGATYVFLWEEGSDPKPITVAAGGGGLAHGPFIDNGKQHGKGVNSTLPNITAPDIGKNPAGAGGGWRRGNFTVSNSTGMSLLEGGRGGMPCFFTQDTIKGGGGFGGGGGGCIAGGGGGGYTGGRAWSESHLNGEGGWSMVEQSAMYQDVKEGAHYGAGQVDIIPAVSGCGCDYRCISLDRARVDITCICPAEWSLAPDQQTCLPKYDEFNSSHLIWIALIAFFIITTLFICISLLLYSRYLNQKTELTQHKISGAPAFRMNAGVTNLRTTEYNPNYEFAGQTIKNLTEIPRTKITLGKAIGSGAFGDVYHGLFRNRATDYVDLPVAVKVLPAFSSTQAEDDFLMEALIMSKFEHPNIVHFIGVCFESHPRFIVLELLAGGDLKKYLRDNRPKPKKPSLLSMKDLIQCAMDVAKGCLYLEDLHFIHRDIAARNCLLTSREPGRVVKIADFGMARDIYRSDYYKKGGKAMLPIKWMPPEAFLDGIFSSKTDVWSFGILLWEVISMGYVPYTGLRNCDVMNYVTKGSRLSMPPHCPPVVYELMMSCWAKDAEKRPSFANIVERLAHCLQDSTVISQPIPRYESSITSPDTYGTQKLMTLSAGDVATGTEYMIPISPETPLSTWNPCVDGNSPKVDNESQPSSTESPESPKEDFSPSVDSKLEEISPDKPFTVSGYYVQDQTTTEC